MRKVNIAIDGPSAAGKSTIAKMLAEKLSYIHLDTGAMYRSVALKAIQNNISLEDEEALCKMLVDTDIKLTPEGKVYLDNVDVTKDIRQDFVSQSASKVSSFANVRKELVKRQQLMAESKGFIMDGRDIGTVVLPNAEVKVYLTASSEARAKRRLIQNKEQNLLVSDLETIKKEIEERDYRDMHRSASPLKCADDAVKIDSSDLTALQVMECIYKLVEPFLSEEES